MATTDEIEIRKPGGFTLKFIEKISKNKFLSIETIEEAFRKLENEGIITYDIINGELQELPDDLVAFENVGWIEFSGNEQKVRLTPKGIKSIEQTTIPFNAIHQFEKVVQDITSQN